LSQWVLLHYHLPREPSAGRVYIWRQLKRLGAILLYAAVWVLPATADSVEQFRRLAVRIVELKGEAMVWETHTMLAGRDDGLIEQFTEQVDQAYRDILIQLKKARPDVAALSRQYQQVQARDYFRSKLGQQVRGALTSASKGDRL
jgi:small-conductance mechanosensitive channel